MKLLPFGRAQQVVTFSHRLMLKIDKASPSRKGGFHDKGRPVFLLEGNPNKMKALRSFRAGTQLQQAAHRVLDSLGAAEGRGLGGYPGQVNSPPCDFGESPSFPSSPLSL